MVRLPLYGLLVFSELPNEADHRVLAGGQGQAEPAPRQGRVKSALRRWARKLHLRPARSG